MKRDVYCQRFDLRRSSSGQSLWELHSRFKTLYIYPIAIVSNHVVVSLGQRMLVMMTDYCAYFTIVCLYEFLIIW